jgi:hypothetical protein
VTNTAQGLGGYGKTFHLQRLGGPMLYVVETSSGLRLNALAGVIYAGPNTSSDPNEAIPGFWLPGA